MNRFCGRHTECACYFLSVVVTCLSITLCRAQPFDEAPRKLSVMTWNVEWMFDDYTGDNRSDLAREQSAPSKERWLDKVAAVAKVIADSQAHIVALQEIEGDQTLAAIAQQIKTKHRTSYRYAFIQGTDRFTEQDVGFLFRGGLFAYRRQEQSKTMFDSGKFYNLSKHLFGEFRWSNVASPLTVLNIHLRATAEAEEPRVKQATLARHWVEPLLAAGHDVIVLGDFNSETRAGDQHSDVGVLSNHASDQPLVDLLTRLEDPKQPTHLILDRQFDRVMVSRSLIEDEPGLDWSLDRVRILSQETVRGRRDGHEHWDQRLTMPVGELDTSDHFPVVAEFSLK
ncbi:MAG: endonuclease/exonuclease/phosphatase family protein [Pirellulaceae bacterium]